MKRFLFFVAGIALLCASCTERRRDADPISNGDTVEVEIQPQPADTVKTIIL